MSRAPVAQRCPVCDRAAARHRVNLRLVPLQEGGRTVGYDRVRDGVTHTDGTHRYDPFCTLVCALRYARAAHANLTKQGKVLTGFRPRKAS